MTEQATPGQEATTVAANQTASAVVNPASETPQPTLYDTLVGDGKKYKDANSLAFGKLNADQHIETLTAELKELRERNNMLEAESTNRKDLESLIAELKQVRGNAPTNTTPSGVESQNGVDVDTIVAKVKSMFDAESKAEIARRNALEVEESLKKVYGESYQTVVADKAKELGLSMEAFVSTMANSPKAAKALLGITTGNSANASQTAPSTINTGALLGQTLTPRQTRIAEIQAMKSKNFHEYLGMQGELNKLLVQERLSK